MSKTILAAFAALVAVSAPAIAVDYSELKSAYSAEGFAGADERWRRLTSNRYAECSRYGDKSNTRLNVLVDNYLAIGEALQSNNEAAAMAATERLSRSINNNKRFEACWNSVARRADVSREFRAMIKDM